MRANFLEFKYIKWIIISVVLLINTACSFGQNNSPLTDSLQLMFYNVENLFDTKNDPATEDDEFTPNGDRFWTVKKYQQKLNHLAQAIINFSGFNLPEIIGLSEIENNEVLTDLIHTQLLKHQPYKIIHSNSQDRRGIDVALLYDSTKIELLYVDYIPARFENGITTRDVLYSKLLVANDSLHLFLNHWPSRYNGAIETEELRLEVAKLLIIKCDSILATNNEAKIILFGDFNDEPDNKSIRKISECKLGNSLEKVFYNLMQYSKFCSGTIKYQGVWSLFDQFIVSRGLFLSQKDIRIRKTLIANQNFLFEDDVKYLGKKPFRTYSGFKYLGGYSDHLPIKLVFDISR